MDFSTFMILGLVICCFASNMWLSEEIKELKTYISDIKKALEDIS